MHEIYTYITHIFFDEVKGKEATEQESGRTHLDVRLGRAGLKLRILICRPFHSVEELGHLPFPPATELPVFADP